MLELLHRLPEPDIEVVKRLVEPVFNLIQIEPDSVMPEGYGPVWYPLARRCPWDSLAAPVDGDTIEFDDRTFAPRHVVGYLPIQPYACFDADWF